MDVAVAWSGDIGACLALMEARERGHRVVALLHGPRRAGGERGPPEVPRDVLDAQARLLGLPLLHGSTGVGLTVVPPQEGAPEEALARGIRALVVGAPPAQRHLLGRILDTVLLREARGERLHTLVLEAPGFREPLRVYAGEEVAGPGWVALEVALPFC